MRELLREVFKEAFKEVLTELLVDTLRKGLEAAKAKLRDNEDDPIN